MRDERVLVLAPHTDDAEFGCGGTMARFAREGKEVFCVAFSAAEASVPPEYPTDVLQHEVRAATGVLGVPPEHLTILKYPVRQFPTFRQDILEDMIAIGREIQPNIVLLPSPHDTHQDHETIAHEGFRAFKRTSMFGYEVPWNNLMFLTQAFVFLDEQDLEAKIRAIACYESQRHRPYADPEFIRSLARTRGMQIGCTYAEVFETIRWVLR